MVDRIRWNTVSYLPFYYVFFQFLLLTIFNLQANILTTKDILSNLDATQDALSQRMQFDNSEQVQYEGIGLVAWQNQSYRMKTEIPVCHQKWTRISSVKCGDTLIFVWDDRRHDSFPWNSCFWVTQQQEIPAVRVGGAGWMWTGQVLPVNEIATGILLPSPRRSGKDVEWGNRT